MRYSGTLNFICAVMVSAQIVTEDCTSQTFIQYTDRLANIRNYYPDFIAVLKDGSHWIVETKGREDVEVILKGNSAIQWCKNATELTSIKWDYIKVLQKEFMNLAPEEFEDLMALNETGKNELF